MSTKSPSSKPKRKRQTKEESKHDSVAPVHKPMKNDTNYVSDSPVQTDNGEVEESSEQSNRTFTYEDKNDNLPPISREISIDTGLQINSKIENGIIGFMEQEIKKEKSKYSHFTDSRPQSLSFYEDEKVPEELSGQLEQLSPEEKRVLKRRRDERKIDIELDASTYKEIQNVLNREKEEVLLAGILKSQKNKSRKKKNFDSNEHIPGIGDSREHMIPNGKKKSKKKKREVSPLPGTSHTKKKHRKRDEHEPRNDITVALEELQDDVFEKDPNEVNHYDGQPKVHNKAANTVYVQKKNGFQATPRDRLFSSVDIPRDGEYDKRFSEMVPLELAVQLQKYWIPFTVLCHGILAGLALTHLIVTQSNIMDEEFINEYKKYSEIYSALFFFLCIICTVSVFDRYDIKHLSFVCLNDIFERKKSAVVILIYICALIIHLINMKHDDHINLYNYLNTDSNSTTIDVMTVDDLNYWNKLSFWRSFLAISGWVFVALGSSEDMLEVHLSSMERFIISA